MRLHYILCFTIIFTSLSLTSSQPHHFLKPPSSSLNLSPTESIELTPPPPTSHLPNPSPLCTLHLFNQSFANTYSQPPFTIEYSPPVNCSPPWSHVVLQLSGEISGNQYDRIAGVWLSGVEILRTSTPEPSDNGTFWKVTKDITRYSSLLQQPNISLSMMLENIVNAEFTGIYHVNLTILYYKNEVARKFGGRKLGLGSGLGLQFEDLGNGVYDEPADLVIPVANEGDQGYWFRIEKGYEVGLKRIEIPINAKRIVLELYVSYHGDDEFWYSNPPNDYIEMNNLTITRGNGASREVIVKIDGKLVGSDVPFPVIFTGGINPLSWDPIVAIGAFDLPSYDYELTPFLGALLDGKSHSIELGVTDAINFWLVDANLHVWLDKESAKVEANAGVSKPSEFELSRQYKFKELDGSFEVKIERKTRSSGWVASSLGNFTTSVDRESKFENKIKFQQNGAEKIVEQKVEVKTQVTVVSDTGLLVSSRTTEREYPLNVVTTTVPGIEIGTDLLTTNIRLELKEKSSVGNLETNLQNVLESGGSLVVKDHSVLSGTAQTQQTLSYKGPSSCFSRTAEAVDGNLVIDSTSVCSSRIKKNHDKMFSSS